MEKETLKKIFNFIQKNDNRNAPLLWKLENDIPLTKEDLNVKGDLYLENSNITSLPEGLMVYGTLDLYRCKQLTSLPEGLEVGGMLNLEGLQMTSLPKGMKVGGILVLNFSEITSLPNDLDVKGSIFLDHCHKLKSLPQGFEVRGNLTLYNSAIESIPEGLEVDGTLNIRYTNLEKYTDDELREMIKPGFIEGEILR